MSVLEANEDGKFMCGIAGIFRPNARKELLLSELRNMGDAMTRRGPDGRGEWCAEGIGLGHTRLSIIDLSHAADQPMLDTESGVIVVFNGEIYNYI